MQPVLHKFNYLKFLSFILLLPLSLNTYADEQYSAQHCKALKEEKERIQERFAKGYGVAEGNYLNARDIELFQLMRKHCVKPTLPNADSLTDDYLTESPSKRTYNVKSINDNWSAHNKTYHGEKADAWLDFYKVPYRCRQKDSTTDDFIYCSEFKAKRRVEFEEYWKNRITLKKGQND